MREFFDGILAAIGGESLTDEEFASLSDDLVDGEYSKVNYEALKAVVQERDGVSGQLKKLNAYFVAKGLDNTGTAIRDPVSSIFFGAALDE